MTVRPDFGPEYGDEERKRFEEEAPPGPNVAEEEKDFFESEARRRKRWSSSIRRANEAHAAGQVCERCGQVITTVAGRPAAAGRPVGPPGGPGWFCKPRVVLAT